MAWPLSTAGHRRAQGPPAAIPDHRLFECLTAIGFKVVSGVTGHEVSEQVGAIQQGVEALKTKGAVGLAMRAGVSYALTEDRMATRGALGNTIARGIADHLGHQARALLTQ